MTDTAPFLARARSDDADRLIEADDPIRQLQSLCGGELNGIIAMPNLLEVVRKSRRFSLKLARAVTVDSETDHITAWVEVSPRDDGEIGCDIVLQHLQTTQAEQRHHTNGHARKVEIDRDLAELTAQLDARQCILSVESQAPDLQALAAQMRSGIGQRWTEFVALDGHSEERNLHWRLLDGITLTAPGSARSWNVTLLPFHVPGQDPKGFQLYLNSDEPYNAVAPPPPSLPPGSSAGPRLVGREVAPVLRQPIARIIANAETIRARLAGPLADEYSSYAADIAAAGQHLLALLDDLSDLEVVEAEEFVTAPDNTDLADVARRACGILGVRARERGIVLEAPRMGESLPVVAEFRRVLQILLNLLSNAIRYSPTNSQVWIRLDQVDDKARMIVADQGPGLSAEQQEHIFDKFERLGRSGDGGSGLGLYISRRLAHAMGGELFVESEVGQGARFILELPVLPGSSIDQTA